VHSARGPSPRPAKLITGSWRRRSAAGTSSRMPGCRRCRRSASRSGRARARAPGRPGCRPGIIQRAGPITGPGPRRTPRWNRPALSRSPGRQKMRPPGRPYPCPASRSVMRNVKENARGPADLALVLGRLAGYPCRTRTGVLLYRAGLRSSVG